uniref:Trigger factor ribosome-binding bacterial domain-containing protein n=1 Tax=Oryza punctata TaxID=4537 RepID=A0A0E0M3E2_ORYPU
MELSIAPAAMAMGRLAKNPKMINHRYASELRLQHCLSPACSVMFNKHCSYRITRKSCSVLQAVSPIPKEIALHIIGPSKVKKETIKNIISFTIAEYVQKEGLDASKNLKVLQSYEELEAAFEPGKEFCFDATLRLQ